MSSTTAVPAMEPPEGETSDFSLLPRTPVQQKFILVYSITFGIAMLLLIARLYTRAFIVRSVGFDDYAVVGSVVFSAAFFGLCVKCMDYGFGRHLWNNEAAWTPMYLKMLIPIVVTYCWAPFMTKLSILWMFHRLNPSKSFRYCIYALMFVITGYNLATTLAVAGGCNPLNTSNTPCINNLALWQAILNIATDFLMLFLPIPMLWKLQAPIAQKLGLGLIFAVGSAVVITSIIRITYIMQILHQVDYTYSEATVCVWSAIELNFGVMCNCLTVLKPFVRTYFPLLIPSSRNARSSDTPGGLSYSWRRKKRSGSHPLSSLDNVSHGYGRSNNHSDNHDHPILVTNEYRVDTRVTHGDDTESMRKFMASDVVAKDFQSRG